MTVRVEGTSPATRLPLEAWGRGILAAIERRADRGQLGRWAFEFLMFGLKQGWACLFGGLMLALLFATNFLWPNDALLARYETFLRPEGRRWPDWSQGQVKKIEGVLDTLEAEVKAL